MKPDIPIFAKRGSLIPLTTSELTKRVTVFLSAPKIEAINSTLESKVRVVVSIVKM